MGVVRSRGSQLPTPKYLLGRVRAVGTVAVASEDGVHLVVVEVLRVRNEAPHAVVFGEGVPRAVLEASGVDRGDGGLAMLLSRGALGVGFGNFKVLARTVFQR